MIKAKLFQPAKNSMQSGTAKSRVWHLTFEQSSAKGTNPLTGHTSSSDTRQQIDLTFPSQEAAIAYAERQNLDYEVIQPKTRKRIVRAYSDNFSTTRIEGNWTH